VTWQPDSYFSGGNGGDYNIAINGTSDDLMYRKARTASTHLGGFTYAIPVATPGFYLVRLHMAETFWGMSGRGGGIGTRVFNIGLETSTGLNGVDIYKEVGAATALVKEFYLPVTDGTLNLNFAATADTPIVSGIEVIRVR
jgi:hypothetical protein